MENKEHIEHKKRIARINELARKNKTVGLSEEEKKEREILRKEYLEVFKKNFENQLKNIKIVDKDEKTKK